MKVLLDMPVSSMLLDVLCVYGHEGVHAHQIGQDRATDRELLEIARREGRVVITADLDFPRLLALSSAEGPGLILFRGGNYSDVEGRAQPDRVLLFARPALRRRVRHRDRHHAPSLRGGRHSSPTLPGGG
jgi:predicted nuclease of predicted toxin-antitoxin system